MSTLTVALLQMAADGPDQDANLRKGDAFCRMARDQGADIALFPEMWNVGYWIPERMTPAAREQWLSLAAGPGSPFLTHFQRMAAELDMAIAITYLESWPGAPRNSVSLIDRTGEIRMTYAKVHTCDFCAEAELTPGDGFRVCTLETAQGPVQVGAMICYDREQPESARILMLQGAEIILTPNACGLDANRLQQFRTRAFENMLGVAMANYAAPSQNGRSTAYDGVAVTEDVNGGSSCLVQAGSEEGVFLASFDLDALRAYRSRDIWGNAWRKPLQYGQLTSAEVREPFIRPDPRARA